MAICYASAWREWDILLARRDISPTEAAKEHLRREGWIVERPETLSLPVQVARSGAFDEASQYQITLHVRANIGGRAYQVNHTIRAQYADMSARAFSGAIASKFSQAIMAELTPQIGLGCEREIELAKR